MDHSDVYTFRKTGIRIGNVAKDADGLENLDDFFAEGLETNGGVFNDLDFGNDNDNDKRVNYSYNNDSSAMDIVNSGSYINILPFSS